MLTYDIKRKREERKVNIELKIMTLKENIKSVVIYLQKKTQRHTQRKIYRVKLDDTN